MRAWWPAVGALSYGRLHLQSRFPHPERLLEDVLVGPTAHPPRSDRSAAAAVRAFRPVEKLGFFVAVVGLVLIIAGDIGLYWLGIDDRFIVTAPAYNAFRIGLLVLAVDPSSSPSQPPATALCLPGACCLSSSGRCAA